MGVHNTLPVTFALNPLPFTALPTRNFQDMLELGTSNGPSSVPLSHTVMSLI